MTNKAIRQKNNELFHLLGVLYLEVIQGKADQEEAKKRLKYIDKKLAKIKRKLSNTKYL
ncbi:hypothetical protein [Sphingobacterium multivorum]|uniref:hypothetical protein n=1 Tax=Sphingobacterium multivorum TaxID=28454 RepID=UPI003DA5276E